MPVCTVQVYEDVKSLRYGHLMIMTDQDHDGSHIKGLIMNFLHTFYPSLLRLPGFLLEFITPIIKVRRSEWSARYTTAAARPSCAVQHHSLQPQLPCCCCLLDAWPLTCKASLA